MFDAGLKVLVHRAEGLVPMLAIELAHRYAFDGPFIEASNIYAESVGV